MALKETLGAMRHHLLQLSSDLEKAARGNKTAAQRVRTGSIHFAKLSKIFRKESVEADKKIRKKR